MSHSKFVTSSLNSGAPSGFSATTLTNSAQNTNAMDVCNARSISFFLDLTRSAATQVQGVPQFRPQGSTTWHTAQSLSVAAGIATSTDLTYSKTVSGSVAWEWSIDVSDFLGDVRLQITSTAAVAADTLTVIVQTAGHS